MHHPSPSHARHDLLLIAGARRGDLTGTERDRAQALVGTCTALRGPPSRPDRDRRRDARPPGPRDGAARLPPLRRSRRRDSGAAAGFEPSSRPFSGARSAWRPVAAAFTSLGVAGLLVAAFLPGMLGSAASHRAGARAIR